MNTTNLAHQSVTLLSRKPGEKPGLHWTRDLRCSVVKEAVKAEEEIEHSTRPGSRGDW